MAALHAMSPEPEPSPVLAVNLNDLTIGDLEDFEDIVGVSFEDAQAGSFRSVKAIKALVFLTMRRDNPAFTIEDARAFKITALNLGDEVDPTDAAGSSS